MDSGYQAVLLEAVEKVNEHQKTLLFSKLQRHFGADVKGRTIALWGLAFKPNTDDMREAPSRVFLEACWASGVSVRAFDPVACEEAERIYGKRADLILCDSAEAALDSADALVVATEWREFRSPDFDRMGELMSARVIIDGRNIYHPAQMQELGFTYYAVGRGA
jgi:UDPglucose 6-dehydrogenase